MIATADGFRVDLTQPLGDGVERRDPARGVVAGIVDLSRCAGLWLARAGPARRECAIDHREPRIASRCTSSSASLEQPQVHPHQTARVYHAKIASQTLFDTAGTPQLDAYYTLRRFPASTAAK